MLFNKKIRKMHFYHRDRKEHRERMLGKITFLTFAILFLDGL